LATAVAAGTAKITATFTGVVYPFAPSGFCSPVQRVTKSSSSTCDVQKPGFLVKTTQLTNNSTCSTQGTTTCVLQRFYRVLDVNRLPINLAGLVIRETVSFSSGSCTGTFADAGRWTTDASGTMTTPDIIFWCCGANSNCFVNFQQQFTVNYFPVLIDDGSGLPPGARNIMKFTCSGGLGSCPVLSVQP